MRPSADGKRTALILGIITSALIMTGVVATGGSVSAAKRPAPTQDSNGNTDTSGELSALIPGIRW